MEEKKSTTSHTGPQDKLPASPQYLATAPLCATCSTGTGLRVINADMDFTTRVHGACVWERSFADKIVKTGSILIIFFSIFLKTTRGYVQIAYFRKKQPASTTLMYPRTPAVYCSRSSFAKMDQSVVSKQSCSCPIAPSGQVFTTLVVTGALLLFGV